MININGATFSAVQNSTEFVQLAPGIRLIVAHVARLAILLTVFRFFYLDYVIDPRVVLTDQNGNEKKHQKCFHFYSSSKMDIDSRPSSGLYYPLYASVVTLGFIGLCVINLSSCQRSKTEPAFDHRDHPMG